MRPPAQSHSHAHVRPPAQSQDNFHVRPLAQSQDNREANLRTRRPAAKPDRRCSGTVFQGDDDGDDHIHRHHMLLAHTASSVTVTITGTPHPPSFVRLITCLHSLKRFCYWGNGGWAPERSPAQWLGKPCAFRRWGGQPKKPRGIPGCTRTGLASLRGSRRWAGQPKEPRWCRESPRRGLASPACPPSLGGAQEPFKTV